MFQKRFKGFMAAAYIAAIAACSALALGSSTEVSRSQASRPPPEIDAAQLFARECSDCHGEQGRGRMLKQPDFTDREWQKRVTDEQLFKSIKWGKEPMPFYAGALTDDEIAALVKYIRSLPDKNSSAENRSAREDNCSSCHRKDQDPVIALFARSAHAAAGITCNSCHKGNAEAADKTAAHGQPFIARPSAEETLVMCGSCHGAQLAAFKASRHFPEQKGITRLDCFQCHGAHTVGAFSPNFSFAYFCSGCHGLEYLPELPGSLQKMLATLDEVREARGRLEQSGRAPSGEIVKRRKELRRLIGEVVHSTDSRAATERLPQMVELGRWIKQAVERHMQ
jgi:mono/diheme cytochrome c family protein